MKKFILLTIALICTFGLVACNTTPSDNLDNNNNSDSIVVDGRLPYTYKEIERYEYFQLFVETEETNVVWSSSNEQVVSVDQTGRVFGVSKGTAIVIATIAGQAFSCEIAVKDSGFIPTVQVDLVYDNIQVRTGSNYTIAPYLMYNGTRYADVVFTFESKNTEVVSVDSNGKLTAKTKGETEVVVGAAWRGCTDILSYSITVIVE